MTSTFSSIPGYMALCIVLTGCSKQDLQDIHLSYDLPAFTQIEILSVFDVDIQEGDKAKIEILGRQDIAEEVMYEVHEDILRIDHGHGKLWLSPGQNRIKLIITTKGLTRLYAKQTCRIQSLSPITSPGFTLTMGSKLNFADLDIDCDYFTYYNTGPTGGQVILRGRAKNLQIYIGSLMGVDAREVVSEYTTVETGSKSDIHIQTLKRLDYSITGIGNIYLWSEPEEILPGEITSTGKLIIL